jgi:hypothetical protein
LSKGDIEPLGLEWVTDQCRLRDHLGDYVPEAHVLQQLHFVLRLLIQLQVLNEGVDLAHGEELINVVGGYFLDTALPKVDEVA